MARVHVVKKSQKDHGSCDRCGKPIVKGDPYKWAKTRPAGPRSSRTHTRCAECPSWRPSELSTSKMAAIMAMQENFEEYGFGELSDIEEFLSQAAETVREVAEEYRESAQNIEDGFGHETAMSTELNEKADELETWAEEFEYWSGEEFDEEAALDTEGFDETDYDTLEDREEAREATIASAKERWLEEQVDNARDIVTNNPF